MLEKEYKVLLTKDEYKKLDKAFIWQKDFEQCNFFYLDSNNYILDNGLTVRVRKKDDQYKLQIKIPTFKDKSLMIKDERELKVEQAYEEIPREIFTQILECEVGKIYKIGELVTKRKIFIIDGYEVCLDYNHYLGVEDYELEIEGSEEMHKGILGILKENNIDLERDAVGKNKRFLLEYFKKNTENNYE